MKRVLSSLTLLRFSLGKVILSSPSQLRRAKSYTIRLSLRLQAQLSQRLGPLLNQRTGRNGLSSLHIQRRTSTTISAYLARLPWHPTMRPSRGIVASLDGVWAYGRRYACEIHVSILGLKGLHPLPPSCTNALHTSITSSTHLLSVLHS